MKSACRSLRELLPFMLAKIETTGGEKTRAFRRIADPVSKKKHFFPAMFDWMCFESIAEFGIFILRHA